MFTGIIEEVGRIRSIARSGAGAGIVIEAKKVLEDVKLGDSIATNGVCLTVNQFDRASFRVDVMAETMRRSNLRNVIVGSRVNLERAVAVGDRLGGHIVSGHIDDIGTIRQREKEDNAVWLTIEPPPELMKYIVLKGSVTIDGVSLTVAYVDSRVLKVSIIPHTRDETTLLDKAIGEIVNIECDVVAKYIERLINFNAQSTVVKNDLSADFLARHGFIK